MILVLVMFVIFCSHYWDNATVVSTVEVVRFNTDQYLEYPLTWFGITIGAFVASYVPWLLTSHFKENFLILTLCVVIWFSTFESVTGMAMIGFSHVFLHIIKLMGTFMYLKYKSDIAIHKKIVDDLGND